MTEGTYIIRPAIYSPVALSGIVVLLSFTESWWCIAAIPFIWLGSICAQPNMNLANGCLAYLAMLIGVGICAWFRPLGLPILFGAITGFYSSAIEKRIRMRPAPYA